MAELTWLRSRHMELGTEVEALQATAAWMDDATMLELWDRITGHVTFFVNDLVPYISVEDEILYPALAVAAETATPIDVLRAHHAEIDRLAADLDEARRALPLGEDDAWRQVRQALYGLYAVARLHFTVEDEIVLPLLEADLDSRDAEELEDAVRAVVHNTQSTLDFQEA